MEKWMDKWTNQRSNCDVHNFYGLFGIQTGGRFVAVWKGLNQDSNKIGMNKIGLMDVLGRHVYIVKLPKIKIRVYMCNEADIFFKLNMVKVLDITSDIAF